jgi:hypothetical protein
VNTTQINDQSLIEEHPQIIITSEIENLTTLVGEVPMNSETKGKVVVFAIITHVIISPPSIVNGEKASRPFIESVTDAVKGEVIQ